MVQRLSHLKTRADFLRVAGRGRKWAMPGLVVQAAARDDQAVDPTAARLGLTASKKVGNAVARNRARRRLRALANEVLPEHGRAELDYVLIGRPATISRAYGDLRADLLAALQRVNRPKQSAKR
ncbi:MAG: ribonuclease P protein component [Kiloniellales bacterium]